MTARTLSLGYSSAVIDLLDREDKSVKSMMLYPITKVQLMAIVDGQVVPVRTFIVNEQDQWVEMR